MPTALAVLLRSLYEPAFVRTGIHFASRQQALEHIGEEMQKQGVVHESYPLALLEREAAFPTGIALEHHAVAIPTAKRFMRNRPLSISFDRILR